MQFKVGDRVEVVEPAECVEDPNNRLGTGTILDADDREYFYVKVDSNTKPWWYAERCLRALPTPTPSITVGTQVRLTGVVVTDEPDIDGDYAVAVEGARKSYNKVWFNPTDFRNLEVIRQPFKRGEVVWQGTTELSVLADEEANTVLLVEPIAGAVAFGADANLFERRP